MIFAYFYKGVTHLYQGEFVSEKAIQFLNNYCIDLIEPFIGSLIALILIYLSVYLILKI